ncbi:glutaredoxin domain-containing protein [Miniphocaeibacter massiliensis]|uniref:glutaredoxin domain-containing protein n=1 Tax=Miniphocaeibacter massiliensis TaxID=2041841 RepID=UPI000C084FBC|nr:glutaredoxin domain-containing protein [Miniphocaeibacter massiliensis]
MEKLIVFGSDKCPDCKPALEELDRLDMEYEFINITDSMSNLKQFLLLRDTKNEFSEIKSNNRVGIPCFYKNEKIFFDIEKIS